jgi:hypothetical protein
MNKVEFVDEITKRTTQIVSCFAKDHQYIMLLAAIEHKLDAEQVGIVVREYIECKPGDRDVVIFTAWDAGVKNEEKFGDAVRLRIQSRENQKRAKEGGMTIREELNDEVFAEFIEASQNYYNAVKYYNDRIDEGTSNVPPERAELKAVIQGLNSELTRLTNQGQ